MDAGLTAMLRYAADENFNNDILRGLRRRDDLLDVVRVQDVELSGVLDPIILDRAAREKVQGILGLPFRHDAEAFLKEPGADIGYTWQDLEDDLRTFARASRR